MTQMRLRRLLYVTLISNLITNLLLGSLLVSAVIWWISESQAEMTPVSSITPGPVASGPVMFQIQPSIEVKSEPEDTRPVHERLGLALEIWERLTQGEVFLDHSGDDDNRKLRAYFLVRASPDRLFKLFSDYANMPNLYEEVKQAKVLESSPDHAVVYYQSSYGFFNLSWVVRESFSADRRKISWKLVDHPKYPSKLKRASGYWIFTPTGMGQMTLLRYENEFKVTMLPRSLATRFAKQNIPKMAQNIRKQLGG